MDTIDVTVMVTLSVWMDFRMKPQIAESVCSPIHAVSTLSTVHGGMHVVWLLFVMYQLQSIGFDVIPWLPWLLSIYDSF